MPNQTTWTKAMLLRLQELHRQGKDVNAITDALFEEFGGPTRGGETSRELIHLNIGPRPGNWTPAMEERIKTLYAAGKNDNEITNQLFHEFAKPKMEQETHRKIQQMKLSDQL